MMSPETSAYLRAVRAEIHAVVREGHGRRWMSYADVDAAWLVIIDEAVTRLYVKGLSDELASDQEAMR